MEKNSGKTFGKTVKSGWLLKRGAKVKTWHRRWFVLDDRAVLRYFRDESLREMLGMLDLKKADSITLAEANPEPWNGIALPAGCKTEGAFAVEMPYRTYFFHAAPLTMAAKWTEILLHNSAVAKAADPTSCDLADDHEYSGGATSAAVEDSAVHFGWLTKLGAKMKFWRRRFFVLNKNGILMYSKGPNQLHRPCGSVDVRFILSLKAGSQMEESEKAAVPKSVSIDRCFSVHTSKRQFSLYCDNAADVAQWIDKLEMAILYATLQSSVLATGPPEPDLPSETVSHGGGDWEQDDEGEGEAADIGSVVVEDAVSPLSAAKFQQQDASAASMRPAVPVGPRSVSAILDPSLYDDMPDIHGLPPADPTLFPALKSALEQELDRLAQAVEAMPISRGRLRSFTAAARLGAARSSESDKEREVLVIYNPVSGSGQGGRVAEEFLAPLLRLAKIKHTIIATEYADHAAEMMGATDISHLDGVVVCGGDGMVAEILTGLLLHGTDAVKRLKVGIIPVGTANAMATELDGGVSERAEEMIHRAALAVAMGHSKRVDVLQVLQQPLAERPSELTMSSPGVTVLRPLDSPRVRYAMSCLAWGLAGACTARAEKLRWIPGNKNFRYDLAGFITLCADWPLVCPCTLRYRLSESEDWIEEKINLVNFVATNQEKLSKAHRIDRDVCANDGKMCLAIIDDTCSRREAIAAALTMRQGGYLSEAAHVRSLLVSEFSIEPTSGTKATVIPMNIDGDSFPPCRVHVQVLKEGMAAYAHPEATLPSSAV